MTPYDSFKADFAGKKILIFGLGTLGRGIGDARLFAQIGCQVRVTDQKSAEQLSESLAQLKDYPIDHTLSGHSEADVLWADCIIKNPSVPWNHPLLELAQSRHIPIYMDGALFVQYANCQTIGITGTRGKTTTTKAIFHLLSKLQLDHQVMLGGNIPPIASLELLPLITKPKNTIVVLELSSWELASFHQYQLSPHIAVLTNLLEDHLNTYETTHAYWHDKAAITAYQSSQDHLFLNQDLQHQVQDWAETTRAQIHWYSASDIPSSLSLQVRGEHNKANFAAALAVGKHFKLDVQQMFDEISSLAPEPARLQVICEHQGISYINDSTSTTPASLLAALNSSNPASTIMIVGGTDKQLPLHNITQRLADCKACITIPGTGTDRLLASFPDTSKPIITPDLSHALATAISLAIPGDTIIFSPGFTSFGQFVNEFDRAAQFNSLVASRTKAA